MHAAVSGTIDFREPDDESCLARLRRLVALLPADPPRQIDRSRRSSRPARPAEDSDHVVQTETSAVRRPRPLACLLDGRPFDEYKAEYGKTLVCGFGRLGGIAVGVVANQRKRSRPREAAPPVRRRDLCRQRRQGRAVHHGLQPDADAAALPAGCQRLHGRPRFRARGIIRRGAKLVNAISNSVVPKITVIMGGSFGAGHYALCGKAFDPRFIFAWPSARYAVMGADQASRTMLDVTWPTQKRQGEDDRPGRVRGLRRRAPQRYDRETDIRYAAARLWVDAILEPARTRESLILAFDVATRCRDLRPLATGVFQV